jgi:hypothetical protein
MRIAVLIFASLAVGVIADMTYGQSPPTISGHHGFMLLTPQMTVVSDAKKTIKYTDPTSGSATSALLLSGHVVLRLRNSAALWSTKLLVINTSINNNTLYAASIRISGSTPTSAVSDRAAPATTTDLLPDCQTVQCVFSASNDNLFVNGIQAPGNKVTDGIPGDPDAVVTVDGANVKISKPEVPPMESPVIMNSSALPITAGGGAGGSDGDGGGDCFDVVSAAAELLHVQPQEIHVQPDVQSKGEHPAEETSSPCIG